MLHIKINFKITKCRFFFAVSFFEILPKFIYFVNSDDFIGKITSKSIRLQPLFIKKRFKVNKKTDFF